jgi:hypothetical protein
MKTVTAIALVIVAVLLTSAVWYVLDNNQGIINWPSQGQNNPNPSSTPTPTPRYISPTPTATPTSTPEPTVEPITEATTPYVPSFTVQYVDHSHDVPPTYKTDPYTGQTVVDHAGYHVDNRTIEVRIKNQAFSSSVTSDGNTTALYYNVRSKGHYEDWNTASNYHSVNQFQASNSGQTVILFYLDNWSIPSGGQVDFQVQAVIGYSYTYISGLCGENTNNAFISMGQSDWSSTQTLTIGNATVTNGTTPYS